MKHSTEDFKRTTEFYEQAKPHRRKPVVPPRVQACKPGRYIRTPGNCNPVLLADDSISEHFANTGKKGNKKNTTQGNNTHGTEL
ncbi:MAG: hypothetical protein IMF09_10315 [Proteobacteria bacterium]|nr:hypothetical protein [Pseudomonadota bacterium]